MNQKKLKKIYDDELNKFANVMNCANNINAFENFTIENILELENISQSNPEKQWEWKKTDEISELGMTRTIEKVYIKTNFDVITESPEKLAAFIHSQKCACLSDYCIGCVYKEALGSGCNKDKMNIWLNQNAGE